MSKNKNIVNLTPMVKQYLSIKENHKDAILFFRMGDFYEMFFEDAVLASKLLEITLTSRNKNKADEIPLCGIPYHAAASYISKLISKGYKVAICEQTEDPKQAKGIVKRDVIKVVTPGLVIDDANLDSKSNNFIMSVIEDGGTFAISYADISTGDVFTSQVDTVSNLASEIFKIEPKEIITTGELKENLFTNNKTYNLNGMLINTANDVTIEEFGFDDLLEFFDKGDVDELRDKKFYCSQKALGILLD